MFNEIMHEYCQKIIPILIGVVICFAIFCVIVVWAGADNWTDTEIADAIYKTEGGAKAKVPYGILSVKVKNEAEARRVCLNTIRNQRKRHASHQCGKEFLDCLSDRYCPPSVDPKGNKAWKRNMRYFLAKQEKHV